jgi:dihydrofolate reductase
MSRVRVLAYSVTLDGFSAGPDQSLENPLGVNGGEMMGWLFPTRYFAKMHGGGEGGETGVDNTMAEESFANVGAWILGRNMFGPIRGPWPNHDWKGWWGEEPPYHCDVFVLTHHARTPLVMKGTTFHFITDGIHEALRRARESAAGRDIRIGGGAATIRQYLRERLVNDLHLALRPVLLGRGESIFRDGNLDLRELGYQVDKCVPGERATHLFLTRT